MNLQLYDDGGILAPLKCGTRFLDRVFDLTTPQRYELAVHQSDIAKIPHWPKIHTLIVRPPKEHLYSALHTDILTEINGEGMDLDIDSIVHSYTKRIDWCTAHWHRKIYETLYWMWRRHKGRIRVVELKDLSKHLTDLGFDIPPYERDDYHFSHLKYHWDMGELIESIKENYKEEWRDIEGQIKEANRFYEYLIKGEIIGTQLI